MNGNKNNHFGALVRWQFGWVLVLALALIAATCVSAAAQVSYTVTDLGTLGGPFGVAHDIDASGEINGFALLPDGTQHAFFRVKGATTNVDLGTLGGLTSDSSFRSSETQVAGGAETAGLDPLGQNWFFFNDGTDQISRAYLWQSPGPMVDLGTLGGYNSYANGINTRGQVVGGAQNGTLDATCASLGLTLQQFRGALWENGQIHELPPLSVDASSFALSINNNGEAVGFSSPSACEGFFGGVSRAVLWQNGTVVLLGSGSLGGTLNNWALNSNDLGQVVGFSDVSGDTAQHAFLYQNGIMTDLGTLPGDAGSFAATINNYGQVVGGSFDESGNERAFLWEHGVMRDLNTLIPSDSPLYLLFAPGINSLGEIVGAAFVMTGPQAGEVHGFLATPVHGGSVRVSPKLNLPQHVRKLLHQQTLSFRKFNCGPNRPLP
jgi:probable HAF family extracellular repeat protein